MYEEMKLEQIFERRNGFVPEQIKKPRELPALEIRPARASDANMLHESMPSSINKAQLAEQEKCDTTFLLALDGDELVGRLVIRWAGTKDDEIRELVPNTPNISMVRTREDQRRRGVGASLMQSAENLARAQGYEQVGLGVALDNEAARRLYQRLGYEDWGHGMYEHTRHMHDPNGGTTQSEIYLIKKLASKV